MRRAVALARAAAGTTAPNPPVGCVIAGAGRIVGEGATGAAGRPHAEERALAAAGEKARGATAYVTLEPCGARSSGAASCADRLVAAGIARVIYGSGNPDARSAGRGPERLRAGGVAVEAEFLAAETEALYIDFIRALKEAKATGPGLEDVRLPRRPGRVRAADHRTTPRGSPFMATLQEVTDRIRTAVGADSGLGKTLKFNLKGEGFVFIDGGTVSNEDKPADLTMTIALNDLVAMGEGKLDAMTAVMTGKLQLSDMGLAMGLQSKMQALFAKMG